MSERRFLERAHFFVHCVVFFAARVVHAHSSLICQPTIALR